MVRVQGLEAMQAEAARFASSLVSVRDRATVVSLSGELGAGKTTFAQAVARHFGVEESVTSPTFVIEKVYDLAHGPFERLIHIDAYRLDGAHDLEMLGWSGILSEPKNLILIEWPERVPGAILPDAIAITLSFVSDAACDITYGN